VDADIELLHIPSCWCLVPVMWTSVTDKLYIDDTSINVERLYDYKMIISFISASLA